MKINCCVSAEDVSKFGICHYVGTTRALSEIHGIVDYIVTQGIIWKRTWHAMSLH